MSFPMTVKMGDHSLMSAVNADGFVLGQGWLAIAESRGSALQISSQKAGKGHVVKFTVPEFQRAL